MKHPLIACRTFLFLTLGLCCATLTAKEDSAKMRTWTSSVGSSIEAKLLRIDNTNAVLERADGSQLTVRFDQLIAADQAFLEAQAEKASRGASTIEGLDASPGKLSAKIECQGAAKWHYYLYLPKDFHDGREWPVWFIMAAGGGANAKTMNRYIAGAERFGCILALSVESKNGFADSDVAMEAMVDDVYDRLPVAKGLAFSSGMSGGSRMAYLLAEREKNIAGVLACGSGSGVYLKEKDFRDAKLRSSTYVYSLIGTNCFNRTGAYKSHADFPDEYRLHFFPGKHVWADAALIEVGMARVLGAGLQKYSNSNADKLRSDYAKQLLPWIQQKIETQPWEAYYFAEFLNGFPGPHDIKNTAGTLAQQLRSHPDVELAQRAEKDILKLARKYFDVYYKEDTKVNDSRKSQADRMATDYANIPHGKLLQLLGEPAKAPGGK